MLRSSFMMLSLMLMLIGCAKTITIGKDPKADAGSASGATKARVYRLAFPVNNPLESSLLLEMVTSFNEAVGRDVMLVPVPTLPTTTTFRWVNDDFASDGSDAHCESTVSIPPSEPAPALVLTMSRAYTDKFLIHKNKLKQTDLYIVFLHCLGHGMGLPHATDATDVMEPNESGAKNLAPFYDQVRDLLKPKA